MPVEAVGRRDPALAAAIKAGKLPDESQWDYVVGRHPLKVGTETRMPGDPIPEAASWPRLESWLNSGAIEKRPPQTSTQLEDIPGDGVVKTGRTVPADGRKHTATITRPRAPKPADETARPVLRPRKGANA